MVQHLASFTTQCLVFIIIPKWENNLAPEDTTVGTNEFINEYDSLGITESDSEGIKKGFLLVLKDNIIDGDVLWTANVCYEYISDFIRLDSSGGNSEVLTVGTYDGEIPGLIDNTILGVADSSKPGKEPRFVINESDYEGIK